MDDAVQADAPEEQGQEAQQGKPGGGAARKKAWRKANPEGRREEMQRWRSRHKAHWRDYQRRYMAERRKRGLLTREIGTESVSCFWR